jgi:flagellar motor component MotA
LFRRRREPRAEARHWSFAWRLTQTWAPACAGDEHLLDFITDYLRLLVSGTMNAWQLENLMDNEIETYREDSDIPEVVKALQCVKVTLPASMNGYAPTIAVEFGRKVNSATERPTFAELEGHVRQLMSR